MNPHVDTSNNTIHNDTKANWSASRIKRFLVNSCLTRVSGEIIDMKRSSNGLMVQKRPPAISPLRDGGPLEAQLYASEVRASLKAYNSKKREICKTCSSEMSAQFFTESSIERIATSRDFDSLFSNICLAETMDEATGVLFRTPSHYESDNVAVPHVEKDITVQHE